MVRSYMTSLERYYMKTLTKSMHVYLTAISKSASLLARF